MSHHWVELALAVALLGLLGCGKETTEAELLSQLQAVVGVEADQQDLDSVEERIDKELRGRDLVRLYESLKERVRGTNSLVWEPQPIHDGRIAFPLYIRVRTRGGDPELLVLFYSGVDGLLTLVECRRSVQFEEGK